MPLTGYPLWVSLLALGAVAALIPLAIFFGRTISPWILPALMVFFLVFGFLRRVRVYEVFVEGAKEGFQVAVRIIPYLVAILVAVGMFRASGGLGAVVNWIGGWTAKVGLPAEALPMAIMRPLSGSGAYGILASIINDPAVGPDSYTGYLVSTLQGSTETTFLRYGRLFRGRAGAAHPTHPGRGIDGGSLRVDFCHPCLQISLRVKQSRPLITHR